MTNKGKMIEAIYAACLTKRATLVIFYLINRANQELTRFPSVGTIAKECNMSTRTVQRALNDLEEAGFLERESRFHERGGQKSSLYKINSEIVCNKDIEEIGFESINSNSEIDNKSVNLKKDDDTVHAEFEESYTDKNAQENFMKRLINKVKIGFSHILPWGL